MRLLLSPERYDGEACPYCLSTVINRDKKQDGTIQASCAKCQSKWEDVPQYDPEDAAYYMTYRHFQCPHNSGLGGIHLPPKVAEYLQKQLRRHEKTGTTPTLLTALLETRLYEADEETTDTLVSLGELFGLRILISSLLNQPPAPALWFSSTIQFAKLINAIRASMCEDALALLIEKLDMNTDLVCELFDRASLKMAVVEQLTDEDGMAYPSIYFYDIYYQLKELEPELSIEEWLVRFVRENKLELALATWTLQQDLESWDEEDED